MIPGSLNTPMMAGAAGPVEAELTWSSNGDTNGLFYYLGTEGGTTSWSNPSERTTNDEYKVTTDYLNVFNTSYLPPEATDRLGEGDNGGTHIYHSTNTNGSWVSFELADGVTLQVDRVTLRNRDFHAHLLKNIKVQGSTDGGSNWTDLWVNSSTWGRDAWNGVTVSDTTEYSSFRVLQNGTDSSNYYYLTVAEIELYGTLTIE